MVDAPALATEADGAATRARSKRAKGKKAATTGRAKAKATRTGSADKPTPRTGTKQALMIELLRRPEGATVEQIAEVTGWQKHTIRGAISGALKKKLGLTLETTRTREVGPNKTGAKGSSTVYRITGSKPSAESGLLPFPLLISTPGRDPTPCTAPAARSGGPNC